jgi:hypothetical protein
MFFKDNEVHVHQNFTREQAKNLQDDGTTVIVFLFPVWLSEYTIMAYRKSTLQITQILWHKPTLRL